MDKNEKAKVVLKIRTPVGEIPKESDFEIKEIEIPEIQDGEFLFQSLYISPDPYQRNRMNTLKDGEIMSGSSVARVVKSKNPKFAIGDIVVPYKGWVSHGVINEKESQTIYRFSSLMLNTVKPSTALGVLGMPGMTAYFGLLRVCEAKEGEVVVVSGAAGAVGSLVGQIAKIKGCTVLGSAGSDEKCEYLKSIGFDHVVNYTTCKDLKAWLSKVAPNGIDCFFDNTGGEIQDAVLKSLRLNSRIAICGQISQYNTASMGPRLLGNLIYTQATIKGFLVFFIYFRMA